MRNNQLFTIPPYKRGILWDETTQSAMLFFDIKPLAAKLRLPYKPLLNTGRTKRIYMGKWRVNFVSVQHETDVNFINPIKFKR